MKSRGRTLRRLRKDLRIYFGNPQFKKYMDVFFNKSKRNEKTGFTPVYEWSVIWNRKTY